MADAQASHALHPQVENKVSDNASGAVALFVSFVNFVVILISHFPAVAFAF
jgi:hypothetical protein